jgi:hypothetical protein
MNSHLKIIYFENLSIIIIISSKKPDIQLSGCIRPDIWQVKKSVIWHDIGYKKPDYLADYSVYPKLNS